MLKIILTTYLTLKDYNDNMNISIKPFVLTAMLLLSCGAWAQKTEKVHGTASYTVGENEHISIAEIKSKCIHNAQQAAIKEAFNERISSLTNMVDGNINGDEISSFYEEVTISTVAEWIGDQKPPVITAEYADDKLTFTAEVWGEAREITKSKTEIEWKTLCNGVTDAYQSTSFKHRDNLYIKFKSPISGYVAIYFIDSASKQAVCMLPYKSDQEGRHQVKAGKEYVFFDKVSDPNAIPLRLTTNEEKEMDQVVLIFSPNSFTKNNDDRGIGKALSTQSREKFEQWLRKLRKQDDDMVVERSTFIIVNENAKK